MNAFLNDSVFFGAFISIFAYEIGLWIKRKFHKAVFNPLLLAIMIVIVILSGFDIDYEVYNAGAKYISFLLTPATVCLAIPLYQQLELLKSHWKAIAAGIMAGVLTTMLTVLGFSILLGLSHSQYMTLLPKSITTAIGMGVSEELGGNVTITVAVIIITGVLGNMIAGLVFKLFRIQEPVAKGIGLGSASHAIGTARAIELGEVEGAMSSLAIAVAGLLTVVTATLFSYFW